MHNRENVINLLNLFTKISETNSANQKVSIVKENKDLDLLLPTLKYLVDEQIVSGLSKKKISKHVTTSDKLANKGFDEVLNYIMANTTGTDITIGMVQGYLNSLELTDNEREMLENIITKRAKYGLSESTVNKVYGAGTVKEWKFMKGDSLEKHEKKVKGPFYITKKMDGNRVFAISKFDGETYDVTYKTKAGSTIEGMEYMNDSIISLHKASVGGTSYDGVVFDGEMLAFDDETMTTNELYRKTQTLIKKKGEKSGMDYYVYDRIPLLYFNRGFYPAPYELRREELTEIFESVSAPYVKLLPVLYYGEDVKEIEKWGNYAHEQGWEGVMLNLANGPYECKRVSHLLKVKKFYYSDVLVLDVYEGDKANKGLLGGVTIQFKDFPPVKVGSGWSQEQREMYWKNPELIRNKIIEVRYFEETENKQGGKSLRFPTLSRVRHDKTIADVSYES